MNSLHWTMRRRLVTAVGASLVAAAACGALVLGWPRGVGEPDRPFDAALEAGWSVAAASVVPSGHGVVALPGADGVIVVRSPHLKVSADLCPTPRLVASSGSIARRVTLAWRRVGDPAAYEFSKMIARQPGDVGDEITFDELAVHRAWKGQIEFIAWRIDAGPEPVELRAVGIEHAGIGDLFAMLWRQWRSFVPINAVSINSAAAPHVLGRGPAAILGWACTLVLSVYVGIAAIRRRAVRIGVALGIVVAAWVVNDARWLERQQRQLSDDRVRFGVPETDRMAAAAWPGEIARMARAAREALPDGAIYAVAGGNLPTAAGDTRLRYVLSPKFVQVNLDPLQPRVPAEKAQYVLVLAPQAAEFEPVSGRLVVPGLPAMRVTAVRQLADGAFIARRVGP